MVLCTYYGILASLGPKGLSDIDSNQQEVIIKAFEQNSFLREFKTLNQILQDRRSLYR